jgi:ribonuclease HII
MCLEMDFLKGREHYRDGNWIAGCDEVGRGPLAGPVVACTVLLRFGKDFSPCTLKSLLKHLKKTGVTDSKKLSASARMRILGEFNLLPAAMRPGQGFVIETVPGITAAFSLAEVSHQRIDEINILNSSLEAMRESFLCCHRMLDCQAEGILLVDGNKIPEIPIKGTHVFSLVKGDTLSVIIGLASIVAKEYRDNLMAMYAHQYPAYGLERHCGYGTPFHLEKIREFGPTPIHRKTFKGVREFLKGPASEG